MLGVNAARAGAPVRLVPEPDNTHDADAIKVMTAGAHVGYIKSKNLKSLRRVLKGVDGQAHVIVWNVHRDDDGNVAAVEIMVIRPGALASTTAELGEVHGPLPA